MTGVIACFGEVLLRYSPPAPLLLAQARQFDVCTGGAEANVAAALARLGHRTLMLTVLPDNVLSKRAKADLASHGVDVAHIVRKEGRMGSYFLDMASGARTGRVTYDREHSAFAESDPTDWPITDWLDGVSHLHVSGITLALSEQLAEATLSLVRTARALGATISFDGNFRAALWSRSQRDPCSAISPLFAVADIVFANHRDAGLLLSRDFCGDGPMRRREAALALLDAFPNISAIASSARHIRDAATHDISVRIDTRNTSEETDQQRISGIVDRIGTGDAFAAGVLHSWLSDPEDLATGAASGLGLMALTLLALTGCRRGEILGLHFQDVHGIRLKLRHGKTGPRMVWMGDDARAVLDTCPRYKDVPWVFWNPTLRKPVRDFHKYWARFRDDAGLRDFRLHDLRHNFASHAAMSKETLPMIGRLLGHAHVQSTARYAHLDDGHALEAAEQIGAAVERMLG